MKPIANILLIDDEADIVRIISEGLRRGGFEVSGFTDPARALTHLREHSEEFCAVLSDIKMPGLTGFQVARKTKEINPKLKVVLMSAFDISPDDFRKVMPATQVDDFIKKPASLVQLKNTLLKHVGGTKQLLDTNEVRGR